MAREHLAARAEVSVSTLTRLELHDRVPNIRALSRIARVLQIEVGSLAELAS